MVKKIKRLGSILLTLVMLICVCTSAVACAYVAPSKVAKRLQGTWYLHSAKYEGEYSKVLTSGIDLFADTGYPLTYDCLQLTFYEDCVVELSGVHFETMTDEMTKCKNLAEGFFSLVSEYEFELTFGQKKYIGKYKEEHYIWETDDPYIIIREQGSDNYVYFERSKEGLSYADYLNSLELGITHTPSGRWYTKGATIYDAYTGKKKYASVSQEVEYWGAPLTEERYIVDFDAENQSLVLSILDIETNTYIEKNGTFKSYKQSAKWACEGTFEDGTEFTVEKAVDYNKKIQFFYLNYEDKTIFWEYEELAD